MIKYLLFGMGVLTIFLSLFFTWSVFIDGQIIGVPLEFNDSIITTDKDTYLPGEYVYGYFDYCKHREISATIQWSLVDTYMRLYPIRDTDAPTGCRAVWLQIEKIPLDSFTGPYHFEGFIKYELNPYNIIVVPIKTNEFIIK